MSHSRPTTHDLTTRLLARGARSLAIGLALGSLVPACASGHGSGRTGTDQSAIIGGVPHDGEDRKSVV
jgi:hypothetical protein